MEESEKRKERLKAMRMGSAYSELGTQSAPSPPVFLVNPLNQPCFAPTLDCSSSAQRFDYYTDPISAFHGNKRKGGDSTHPRLNNFPSPPCYDSPRAHVRQAIEAGSNQPSIPDNRFQMNYPPYQGLRGMQFPILQTTPWSSPVARGNPFSMQRPPGLSGPSYRLPDDSSPRFPYSSTSRSGFISSQGQGSNPGVYPGRGTNHTFLGRGENSHLVNSPTSHPGWRNSYGWKSSKDYASTGGNPQSFFIKQMVEDPWKDLEPVVGNILETFTNLSTTDSWLPKSIVTKKTKINEASKGSGTLNLAEYLAQSFEEAASDEIET